MKKYYIPLLILISTLSGYAGAQRWSVILSSSGTSGPNSYTIPAGKVFILEAATLTADGAQPTDTQIRAILQANNEATVVQPKIVIKDTFEQGAMVWLPNKISLKSGELILVPLNATYTHVFYYGVLIDEADLYAVNLPVELENTRVAGSKLMADAKVKSPRPHKITVQSSPDMTGFTEDATAGVAATGTTGTSVVSVDKGATGKKFLRVAAQTRPRR